MLAQEREGLVSSSSEGTRPQEHIMPTGRIKYYNFDKGFGFIAQDSSDADVFLHSSAIKYHEYEELRVGQRVKYSVVEGEKGLVAQNVEVLLTPTERRWLRQGKAVIPRGYAGIPGQGPGQFGGGESTEGRDYGADDSAPIRRRSDRRGAKGSSRSAKPARDQQPETEKPDQSAAPPQKSQDPASKQLSFGDLYILKQINFETSMFFALYDQQQLPATVLEMTFSSLTLNSKGSEQQLPKTDVKYFYKDVDARRVQASLEIDEVVRALQLRQLGADAQAPDIDTEPVQHARKNGMQITITLREGEVFRGTIDWVSPDEIKLVLRNSAKVVIFRHAIHSFTVGEVV